MDYKDQVGFLTLAQNSSFNYLELAYLQALSIKLTMPNYKYAVIVDSETMNDFQEHYWDVIDYVIPLQIDCAKTNSNKFLNEWQVLQLTPFKETIKLESDLLITRDISHWLYAFRLRSIVLSTGTKNFKQQPSVSRAYRSIFDINDLPDIYNGLMYFRLSPISFRFFSIAKELFLNWDIIKNNFKKCANVEASTDLIYSIAARIVGVENCTLPLDWINFVHMKPAINNLPELPWIETIMQEVDAPMVRIGNLNQYYPFHYQDKNWVTQDLIKEYENGLMERTNKSI